MIKVVTAEEMQELDRRATADYGIPSLLLMEHAGAGVAREVHRFFPRLRTQRVVILCGKGNNGGDGFAAARHLANHGNAVQVYLLTRREEVKGDARVNLEMLDRLDLRPTEVTTSEALKAAKAEIAKADVVVDALLGTGIAGSPKGLMAETIEAVNTIGRPTVAVDVPSGLGSGDPPLPGPCIRADLTVTLALPKRSLVLYPMARWAGEVRVVDIGMPRALLTDPGLRVNLVEAPDLAGAFPPREPDAHKGTFGHVLVVAGGLGKTGAASLCSQAALRVGAGLVTLALPQSLNGAMEAQLTEVMTEPLPETEARTLAPASLERILALTEGKSAVALGPGLSTHPGTAALVCELLVQLRLPVVVDADAINALAGRSEILSRAPGPVILTPHPGELRRLLSLGREELLEQRVSVARKMAEHYNLYLVLKGARTLVADPKGEVFINPTGNPGMATAGTGDVLTGMLAGLVGRGLELGLAVRAGVYLHGLAGDLAARDLGQEAMVAGDLLARLPAAIRTLKASVLLRPTDSDRGKVPGVGNLETA